MSKVKITRRSALKAAAAAAGFAAPMVFRNYVHAAPNGTLDHVSFGAAGMAGADLRAITASRHVRLVAVAEVDNARTVEVRKAFPNCRIYQDWRELLDKEKSIDSANVSTPDHMHAPITMRLLQRNVNVYTQKPLTQSIFEARQLARVAGQRKVVTQMGIQIHSHEVHKTVVRLVQSGVVGRIREAYSWSGKHWGDTNPRPVRNDKVPNGLNWDGWLGVAAERPYLRGYYHPGEWRKRLDFGTGTFGDMGCHILDPVFTALALGSPTSVRAEAGAANADSWGLNCEVRYTFPGTRYTTDTLTLTWYDGNARPPAKIRELLGTIRLNDQGSIYVGTNGTIYSPYIGPPVLLPAERFRDAKIERVPGDNHYLQFVEACRGNGQTSTPFSYSGPLTESVLLGCLATRFQQTTLNWDTQNLRVTNNADASRLVRRTYRKGWEVEGL